MLNIVTVKWEDVGEPNMNINSGIPYSTHGAQITPSPLFLIFVYFLFLCLF